MLQPITFNVIIEDGSGVNVTASAPDYVAFELKFDKSALLAIQEGMWTYYMYILWHSMSRQSIITQGWDEWLATSPTFSREVKSEEPVPLESGPQPGPLPA